MKPYQCHNRPPFAISIQVQDGWEIQPLGVSGFTRIPVMVEMLVRATTNCNYTTTDLGQADARCHGCIHRSQQ